jgi:succinoglycan biosynthesis protein ExoM
MTDLNEESLTEFLASDEVQEALRRNDELKARNREYMAKTHIAVCVCTRNRPLMLKKCLESLLRQKTPDGCRLSVTVVNNNKTSDSTYDVVSDVCQRISSDKWVTFIDEPVAGIPQARNAALADAMARKADWIAFIDDDETATETWVDDLYRASVCYGADVVQGQVKQIYPAETPSWLKRGQWRPDRSVRPIDYAITNNVLFRVDTARNNDIAFDNRLRFIGGEDKAFFSAMGKCGATMIYAPQALVYEEIPHERTTFRWQLRNAFRKGICKVTEARFDGKRHVRVNAVISSVRASVSCLAKVLVSPVVMLAGPSRGAYVFFSGCRDGAKAVGSVAGLLGYEFEYYKTTTGY